MKLQNAIPAFPVKSIEKSVAFYEEKLGFNCVFKERNYASVMRDDIIIHFWTANSKKWLWSSIILFIKPIRMGNESFLSGTSSCTIKVEGIDELFEEYKLKGILHSTSHMVEKTRWQTNKFSAVDLNGNILTFFEDIPGKSE